jgi:uncharacterized protein (TIGR02391 family)
MALSPFSPGQIEHFARILGDSTTGSELDRMLHELRMPPSAVSTKWRRLRDSFEQVQRRDGAGDAVARFVKVALAPDRFFGDRETHEALRSSANEVFSFAGLELRADGKLVRVTAARRLDEAEQRADRLRAKLRARDVHPDVLAFCRTELLQENYFHAVLEAAKSVAQKIRDRTGLQDDASTLADAAFASRDNMPPLAFNRLSDPNEVSEHRGLAMMIKGFFMTFRNTTAHAPKVKWAINDADALDMLAQASTFHRRLDDATVTPAAPAYLAFQR